MNRYHFSLVSMTRLTQSLAIALCTLLAASAFADENEAPKTHQAKKGVLNTKVKLSAIFESTEMTPIKLEPEVWADLTIKSVASHGSTVKKGDVLVALETEDIDEKITEEEEAVAAGRLSLQTALAELENLKQTTPRKLEAAQRAKRIADEDYNYFEEIDRKEREKGVEWSLKSAQQRLENAAEELNQLEQMYKEDDLTEETEEIILKRQKYAVESAQYSLERARLLAKRSMETLIPRERETLLTAKIDNDLNLELLENTLPAALKKAIIDTDKKKRDFDKSVEKLADLKGDRELMITRAPGDGIVYYGACDDGKWTSGATVAKKLKKGGKLVAKEIFMTVVDPGALRLRAVVAEKDLAKVKVGLDGEAAPVSDPESKFKASVASIEFIPHPAGGFPALIEVDLPRKAHIAAGMNCSVTFEKRLKSQGVLVPRSAVITEDDKQFVHRLKDKNDHEKIEVKTGESDLKMIDVIEGLSEGDKVLLEQP